MSGEAMWRLTQDALSRGAWGKALAWTQLAEKKIPPETGWFAGGRRDYWKGRILTKLGRTQQARRAFQAAVDKHPLSYYSLLAIARQTEGRGARRAGRLSLPPKVRQDQRRLRRARNWLPDLPANILNGALFKRAQWLAQAGLGQWSRHELMRLPPETQSEALQWHKGHLMGTGRQWHRAHRVARDELTAFQAHWPDPTNLSKWRLAYPRAYPWLVNKHAATANIHPSLAWAIMREESGFNPTVESAANAVGLMQLLVSTANRFTKDKADARTLRRPPDNISAGTAYLGFLAQRFSQHPALVIAAYNAGSGAVDKWLKARPGMDTDLFVEAIPYNETRGYTKRVMASLFAYHFLYDQSQPAPMMPETVDLPAASSGPGAASKKTKSKARRRSGSRRGAT